MKLSISLPATLDEIEQFTAICRSLGLLGHYQPVICGDDMEGYELPGIIDHDDMAATPPPAPPVEPPAPAAKPPKVAKRAADRAPAKKKAAKASGGDTVQAITAALRKMGGRWEGSAPSFITQANLTAHALNVLPKMEADGRIRITKTAGGRVAAIELVNAATPANVTALPQPNPARHPAAPAPLPAGGIQAPAGGWA